MSAKVTDSAFPTVPGGASLQFGLADYIGKKDADAISKMASERQLFEQMAAAEGELKNPTPDTLSLSAAAKGNTPAAQTTLAQAIQQQQGGMAGVGQLPQPGQNPMQQGMMPGVGGMSDLANPKVLLPILGASALGGLGIAHGMDKLFQSNGDAAAPIVRAAQRVDNFAPSKWLNKHLSKGHGRLDRTRFGPQLKIATGERNGVEVVSEHTEHMFEEMKRRFGRDSEGKLTEIFTPVREAIESGRATQTPEAIQAATKEFEALGKNLIKGPQREELLKLGKGGWRTRWGLRTFSNAIRGRHTSITMGEPLERALVALPKEVGPIGKMVVTVTGLLKRAVAAESLTGHGGGGLGKYLGPILGGGALFGFAFWDAHKAKKGDKTKSFMHNLLGVGLGGLVGFEMAEMLFKRTNLIGKLLPSLASRGLPVALGPTLGGLAVFLIAQTIFFKPFSKIGECISDKIFGKPEKVKEEELKKKGIRTETPETFNPTGEQVQIPDVFKQFQNQKPSGRSPLPQPPATEGPTPDRIRMSPIREAQDQINGSVAAQNGTPDHEMPLTDLNNLIASQSGGH